MLIPVIKMPNVRRVEIYGLFYQPQSEDLCIKIDVALWVSGNSCYVVNTVWGHTHLNLQSIGGGKHPRYLEIPRGQEDVLVLGFAPKDFLYASNYFFKTLNTLLVQLPCPLDFQCQN